MANKIAIDVSTYLQDFSGVQATTPNFTLNTLTGYVEYAIHLDTNFNTLRTTINTMIDELNAVQGPNAGLGIDILTFDDANRTDSGEPGDAAGELTTGIVGQASFALTISTTSSADDSVDIDPGTIIIDGVAISNTNGATLVGSGGAGTRYVNIDLNGTLSLSTVNDDADADLWEITWTGTAFTTSSEVNQQRHFFDGDEYDAMVRRPAAGSDPITFPALVFDGGFHQRVEAIERLLAGFSTDNESNSLGQPALRAGSAATPGLVFNADSNTGFYAPGADRLGFSTAGTQVAEFDSAGNLDLPTNGRVQSEATTFQDFTDNTQANVDFGDSDVYDIGGWHNPGGSATEIEEFTVPTGYAGTYLICYEFEWEAGVDANNDISMYTMLNGTTIGTHDIARFQRQVASGDDCSGSLTTVAELSDADIIRIVALVDTSAGSNMGLDSSRLTIVKLA